MVSVAGVGFWKVLTVAEQLAKWTLTTGAMVGHMHYGLRVQVPSGEIGVVDLVELAAGYVSPEDWPAIGSVITVLGAGYCVVNFG